MAQTVPRRASAIDAAHIEELERTLEALRDDAEVTHVLLGLTSALAEVRSFQDTLDLAVATLTDVFGADRCFAATWDRAHERFDVRATSGFSDELLEVIRGLAEQPSGLPFIRRAIETREVVFVPDVSLDDALSEERRGLRDLGAYIGIPLSRWGTEFGGLGVEFSKPRTFSTKEVSLARGIGTPLAMALSNARQFGLLEKLRGFGLGVGSKLRLDLVIEKIVAGASNLLSSDGAVLFFLDSTNQSLVAAGVYGSSPAETAENLSRIDAQNEPWNGILEGRTVLVPELHRLTGDGNQETSAVLTPIPGADDSFLGALLVYFQGQLTLGPDETGALSVFASQSGIAIENARRFERQRRVARSLQAGLLATDVPPLGSCEVGMVYEPANEEADVGGDFFDIFEVSEDRFGIVVGDVSGKGAEAAAQTAMAKYMLRAFAIRNPAPSSVLYHLNNALVTGFGEDRFATVVYGVFETSTRHCTIAAAGHPPPLIYRSETADIESVEVQGSILGAFEDQSYEQQSVELGANDSFLAFTDGLMETRSGDDFFGLERVREAFARHAPKLSGLELARSLYREAQDFGQVGDDTVVFTLTCRGDAGA